MAERSESESTWNAYLTEDGDLWAAFVTGHVEIDDIDDVETEERIVEAYGKHGEGFADDARAAIDERCGLILKHFWLKPVDPEGMFQIAKEGDEGAFPVTGMQFDASTEFEED